MRMMPRSCSLQLRLYSRSRSREVGLGSLPVVMVDVTTGRRTPMWDDTEEGPLVSSSNSMKAGDEMDSIETKKEVGQPERKTQKQKNK